MSVLCVFYGQYAHIPISVLSSEEVLIDGVIQGVSNIMNIAGKMLSIAHLRLTQHSLVIVCGVDAVE